MRLGVHPRRVVEASVAAPAAVFHLHRAYAFSGAQILTANTFAAEYTENSVRAMTASILTALSAAAGADADLALLIPLSAYSPPAGTVEILRRSLDRVAVSSHILVETCGSLARGVSFLRELTRHGFQRSGITCHVLADGRLPDGTTAGTAARAFTDEGADIVGANCGDTLSGMLAACSEMRAATSAILLMQPNYGPPVSAGSTVDRLTPARFGAAAVELVRLGSDIVGGCCGTTPEHIRAAAAALASGAPIHTPSGHPICRAGETI